MSSSGFGRTPADEEDETPVLLEVAARPVSFEQFFVQEYRSVVNLAVALSGSNAGAEDIAQDAFARAHRRWTRIAKYDNPGAWVRRVATNLALSAIRRRTREVRALMRLRARPEPEVAIPEPAQEFWTAVRALPRRQAQCVALRYLEDRSTKETAAILGIEESTVRVHLHSACLSLARQLGEATEDQE